MNLLRQLLRVYSYVYETVLCAMGLLLSMFGMANRNLDIHIDWLPWSGPRELQWILGLSLVGLVCVGLAVSGIARVPLFLFSGVVLYILVRGLFLSTRYTFSGHSDLHYALLVVLGAALAFVGAFPLTARSR